MSSSTSSCPCLPDPDDPMMVWRDTLECQVPASDMWRVAFADAHNSLPKALPHLVQRVDYQHSSSPAPSPVSDASSPDDHDSADADLFRPGSVRTLILLPSLCEQMHKQRHPHYYVEFIREHIDHIDHAARSIRITVIGGGFLGLYLKHYHYNVQIANGLLHPTTSCIITWTVHYQVLSSEYLQLIPLAFKEAFPTRFVGVEAYLLAPHQYNASNDEEDA